MDFRPVSAQRSGISRILPAAVHRKGRPMKNERQAAILSIIESRDIETQEELAEALRENGISVTQATVSRDIKELRLLKVLTGRGTYKYALADKAQHAMSDRFVQIFVATVVSIEYAQNIIVIKTIPASANVAAEAVDGMHLKEVLGTMAGDNTVLVIVHNEEEALTVSEHFRKIIK